MALLPEDMSVDIKAAIDELESAVTEMESRLESTRAERDGARARQVELEIENANLRRDLALAREQQSASADVLGTIANSSDNADHALRQIAETTMRMFGAPSATIHIAEGDGWSKIIRVGDSSKRVGQGVPESQLKIGGRNMPGTIVGDNRQVHVPDLDNVDPDIADWPGLPHVRAAGTKSMSGSPLRSEGKAIGALIVYRDGLRPFTDAELALQQSFADQAAIAIENARLIRQTREALERQTATAEILKVIAASPSDVQPVFEAIVTSAKRLFGAFSTTVLHYINDELHLAAFTPTGAEADAGLQASFPRRVADFPIFEQIRNGVTLQFPDTEADNVPAMNRDLGRLRGFRSVVFMPLMSRGEAVGILSVTRTEPGAFAEHHLQLLQTFADQAVIAIENTRLFNETREALERQTATADILKVIASSPSDVKPVFDAIVHSANRLIGGFSTALFRHADGKVHLAAFTPTDPAGDAVLQSSFPVPFDRFPPYELTRDGAHAELPDTETEPAARDIARARGYRSMLFAPLMDNGESIGIITVTRITPGSFDEQHVRLLEMFANQAVIAIDNVRLFNELQTRTRELSRSLDNLRAAQDRLVQTEKLASLGQLTAGIAHEIKNPLNFVNNFAALSAELTGELNDALKPAVIDEAVRAEVDELTGLLRDNLQKIVHHGKRADSIVKNMLLHSREGSGDSRAADINALVEESLNLAYHGARAEKPDFNVTLEREFDPEAGLAEVFPQEITRVFLNLVSNGFYAVTRRRKDSGEPGYEPTLRATTRNLGNTVEIRIHDNGTGIPPEVRERMFNPFFTTKPAGEGTGLGLSMSHDIVVKQHGGTIDVDTEPGRFTEFRIVLPRAGAFPDAIKG